MTAERTCEVVAMSATPWAKMFDELRELKQADQEPSLAALKPCQGGAAEMAQAAVQYVEDRAAWLTGSIITISGRRYVTVDHVVLQ